MFSMGLVDWVGFYAVWINIVRDGQYEQTIGELYT